MFKTSPLLTGFFFQFYSIEILYYGTLQHIVNEYDEYPTGAMYFHELSNTEA